MTKGCFLGVLFPLLSASIGHFDAALTAPGIKYVKIPPLSSERDTDFSLMVNYGKTSSDNYLSVSFKKAEETSYTAIFQGYVSGKTATKTLSFSHYQAVTGVITIRVEAKGGNIDGSEIRFFYASKVTPCNISLSSNYVESYSTPANYVYYNGVTETTNNLAETFTFSGFQKEQEQSYYNYLDMHGISFKYSGPTMEELTVGECFMYVQNVNGWFSGIGTSFGNFRKISLTVSKEDDGYHFEPTDVYYIDTDTNRLYSSYVENSMQTKRLYLPKNGYDELDSIQINFNCKGVGLNESTISQNFLFSVSRNYFGDCYNSEYCISATQTESDFDCGEVEEH